MKSILDSIVGILMLFAIGSCFPALYKAVKKEALLKVYQGLHSSLGKDTRALTQTRLKY